jgi:hypothetical protein
MFLGPLTHFSGVVGWREYFLFRSVYHALKKEKKIPCEKKSSHGSKKSRRLINNKTMIYGLIIS